MCFFVFLRAFVVGNPFGSHDKCVIIAAAFVSDYAQRKAKLSEKAMRYGRSPDRRFDRLGLRQIGFVFSNQGPEARDTEYTRDDYVPCSIFDIPTLFASLFPFSFSLFTFYFLLFRLPSSVLSINSKLRTQNSQPTLGFAYYTINSPILQVYSVGRADLPFKSS